MAHLAVCCARALCASRPPHPTQRSAHLAQRRSVRGQAVVVAAARPAAAAAGAGTTSGSTTGGSSASTARSPSARELARQQRARQQAQDVQLRLQQRAALYGRPSGGTSSSQGVPQVEAVAAELLLAGLSQAAVVRVLNAQADLAALGQQSLEHKLASVREFLKGVKHGRPSSLDKLCYAAVSAAIAQRSDASVAARCTVLAQLCAAATGSPAPDAECKEAVLERVSQQALDDLFTALDGAELQAVFQALQSQLGWSPQHAAAALLNLGLPQRSATAAASAGALPSSAVRVQFYPRVEVLKDQTPARAALLRTTAQHIEAVGALLRERGFEGGQLAHLTQLTCARWAACSTADAQAALQALEAAQLPPRLAAVLWLGFGPAAAGQDFLAIVKQMKEAGVSAQQLELFGAMLASTSTEEDPRLFERSKDILSSWRARAEAALADSSLPNMQPATADTTVQQPASSGLSQSQLKQLAFALGTSGPDRVAGALSMLQQMMSSDLQAAVELALGDPILLCLPSTTDMQRIVTGLGTAGLDRGQLLRLAKVTAHDEFAGSFAALAEQVYGGDWRAAALRFLQEQPELEPGMRSLPPVLRSMQQAGFECANEHGRERVLMHMKGYVSGTPSWYMRVPVGMPSAQRRTVAEAALDAEGFRAASGRALETMERLVAGRIDSIYFLFN